MKDEWVEADDEVWVWAGDAVWFGRPDTGAYHMIRYVGPARLPKTLCDADRVFASWEKERGLFSSEDVCEVCLEAFSNETD